ncbi:hypothetical protein T492DRAFT_989364 [Pavlovales sp. CCMP2436]|nr:hypothetical protein T492DRAFT_989364 [Pavlovales sp. CCMP2436]
MAEEGGSLTHLDETDLDARLAQLSQAQLEALVENETNNLAFEQFFDALAPVQRAQAEEEQLLRSCGVLARASIDRARALGPALAAAAEAMIRVEEDTAQLIELHAASHSTWREHASGDAVEKRLNSEVARARSEVAALRSSIERGDSSVEEERTLNAFLASARLRHRSELTLIALRRLRGLS